MSWRTLDIINAYQRLWLIEVFFEDWKRYEGWGQLAKQPGVEARVGCAEERSASFDSLIIHDALRQLSASYELDH